MDIGLPFVHLFIVDLLFFLSVSDINSANLMLVIVGVETLD